MQQPMLPAYNLHARLETRVKRRTGEKVVVRTFPLSFSLCRYDFLQKMLLPCGIPPKPTAAAEEEEEEEAELQQNQQQENK